MRIAFSKTFLFFFLVFVFIPPAPIHAQEIEPDNAESAQIVSPLPIHSSEEYFRARILSVVSEGTTMIETGYREQFQELEVKILSGREKGIVREFKHTGIETLDRLQTYRAGDTVVMVRVEYPRRGVEYYIHDYYRAPSLIWIVGIFFALAILFGRWKGLTSIVGLAFSILVIVKFIVPRLVEGSDPLAVIVAGSGIILCISLFLAHGFNRRTTLSFISTLVTLGISVGITALFVSLARLSGLGTEEAVFLQSDSIATLDLRGLLLGGIIIGTLGVLDDITTAQTAVVGELSEANPTLSPSDLFKRGISVGREHIASLINTLVLAYAGASLPLFLLFSLNNTNPLWITLNSEFLAEEIIRTLVGSSALILAVPIATALAAYALKPRRP